MRSLPRKASEAVRKSIIGALGDRDRRFLDARSSSLNWLVAWGIKADGLFEDLIEGLESSDNLFLKSAAPSSSGQSYQCILDYPEDGGEYPAVLVHVTLAPKGDPPRVRVAVHPSDTVKTLPALRFHPKNDENH